MFATGAFMTHVMWAVALIYGFSSTVTVGALIAARVSPRFRAQLIN